MKNEVILYEKIYENLKNKIECGLLPGGYRLPSRAEMCRDFETSEKPVRCAIEMLVRDGLVETEPRKRPIVAYRQNAVHRAAEVSLQRAASTIANDAMRTGVFLCYPVIGRGISLCREEDWIIPQTIAGHMDPKETAKFWRLSNSFWRFFIARNGNEFILRVVDSMGYTELEALNGGLEVREGYLKKLKEFLCVVREGGDPASVQFEDMSQIYGYNSRKNRDAPTYQVPPDSVFLLGAGQLEQKVRRREERYSRVYLDIIGMIAIGGYKQGDYLPSHKELQKSYGVSIDTTLKAVKTLKELGVVNAAPRKGIWVTMDAEELKKLHIDPMLVGCHIRRFLDSLELLTLILEGTAVHAMERVGQDEIRHLNAALESQWNDPLMFHFFPSALLEFITDHIQYEMLRSIFVVLRQNFRIGRIIPKLIDREKNGMDHENYEKCHAAAGRLADGDIRSFAKMTAELFQDIYEQIIASCKKNGYWTAAMQVYDGTALWR